MNPNPAAKASNDPPIDWPKVTIGGEAFELKYEFRVTYRASKAGIDLRNLSNFSGTMAAHLDLFTIMVQPIFERRGEVPPTAEQWCERIEEEHGSKSMDFFKSIATAVIKAYSLGSKNKPAAAALMSQETAPGQTPN